MPTRIWIARKGTLKDPKQGYSISKTRSKKSPWRSEVWYGSRIARTDEWPTREKAESYIRGRKKAWYGGK